MSLVLCNHEATRSGWRAITREARVQLPALFVVCLVVFLRLRSRSLRFGYSRRGGRRRRFAWLSLAYKGRRARVRSCPCFRPRDARARTCMGRPPPPRAHPRTLLLDIDQLLGRSVRTRACAMFHSHAVRVCTSSYRPRKCEKGGAQFKQQQAVLTRRTRMSPARNNCNSIAIKSSSRGWRAARGSPCLFLPV